jgi:FkbM family methyltransferase
MASVFSGFPHLVSALDVEPRHLIHVGAHKGEEVQFYLEAGMERITLVEPIPELAEDLRQSFPFASVVEAACNAEPGRATLSIMSKTNLSTLGEPQKADTVVREVEVDVVRLDSIQGDANIAVIDAQGLEVYVLMGADLIMFDLVIAECSTVFDPTIAASYDELDDFMAAAGFREVNKWARDYQWINRWRRGPKARHASRERGSVYDVAYARLEK